MAHILLIGCGNPLRSDDGLGRHVVEALREKLHGVDVLAVHQLTPELAEPVSRADFVIFIDAAIGSVAGTIKSQCIEPQQSSVSTHHLTPPGLLHLVEVIYGRCPHAVALSITGQTFALGESLSPVVQAALPELFATIKALITQEAKSYA
jgi:hydrogenase maturation protease